MGVLDVLGVKEFGGSGGLGDFGFWAKGLGGLEGLGWFWAFEGLGDFLGFRIRVIWVP